ncbi:hypothetical protein [Paenibacillus flagellatus]|uniref:Uncharacterized protein n=1 Tax=Paenibacillus flagellatus TaxID=2211139 RepID=A0A2V5JZ71_9BACL|nr:hypothetical protein [Paenibacillus flagellatus]PYI52031.1 hypothetical protein DLM86_21325 [Paenibacillus flagellatus]
MAMTDKYALESSVPIQLPPKGQAQVDLKLEEKPYAIPELEVGLCFKIRTKRKVVKKRYRYRLPPGLVIPGAGKPLEVCAFEKACARRIRRCARKRYGSGRRVKISMSVTIKLNASVIYRQLSQIRN